jgi:hypothetical protein
MERRSMFGRTLLLATGAVLLLTAAPIRAQQLPQTGAERAGWSRHTNHEELTEFLFEVQARTDKMRVRELTTTWEGRTVWLVVLGDPPPATPGTAWLSGKPTVLLVENVHGGELSGREGGLQLLRELALGDLQPLLSQVNVLYVPSINPDGAAATPRPSRTNSYGYDMNRDYVVMETPEISALVEDVLLEWWPDVHMDSHNGGSYPYNLTYQSTLHPSADPELVALANGPMYEAVKAHMESQGLMLHWYSGSRRNPETGVWQWTTTDPNLRKQHSYSGFQNMIALLFECPGGTLEEQARAQREGQEGLLRYVAAHGQEIRSTIIAARRRTVTGARPEVPIGWEVTTYPGKVQFYARASRDEEPQLVEGVLRTKYIASETRQRPWAYAFDGNLHEVADILRRHAIEVERLREPVTLETEKYRLTRLDFATRVYQDHLMADVDVEVFTEETVLPAGTYLVRMAQNAAMAASYMLEPDTDDSLVDWNFLDWALRGPPGAPAGGAGGGRTDPEAMGARPQRVQQGSVIPIYRLMRPVGVKAVLLP